MEHNTPTYQFNYTRTFTEKSTYASFMRYLMTIVSFTNEHHITECSIRFMGMGDYLTSFVKRGWYLIGAVFNDKHKTTYVNVPFPTDDNFKKHFKNLLASPQSNPAFNFSLYEDRRLTGKNEDGTKTRFRIWMGHCWKYPRVVLAFARRDYVFEQLSKLGFDPKILAKLEKPFTMNSCAFYFRGIYETNITLRKVGRKHKTLRISSHW